MKNFPISITTFYSVIPDHKILLTFLDCLEFFCNSPPKKFQVIPDVDCVSSRSRTPSLYTGTPLAESETPGPLRVKSRARGLMAELESRAEGTSIQKPEKRALAWR